MATSVTSKSLSGFDPRSTIPGCVLWLDASQELGSNGTYMNTITDRSASGYSITATTSNTITLATNYLNGNPVYNFGSYNRAIVPNFNWNVSFTVFFVTQFNAGDFLYAQWNPSIPGYTNYVYPGNWNLIDIANTFGPNDSVIAQGTSVTGSGWNVFCIGYSAGATTCSPYSVNGTIRTTQTGTGTSTQMGLYPLYINGNGNGGADVGYVAEIIHYNQNLTVAQAQQVEGYLAWKWGLQLQTNMIISPTSIPNCILWLDASDSSTITLSNSYVTAWTDKSGYGGALNTSSGSSYYCTYSSNGLNNLPSIISGSSSVSGRLVGSFGSVGSSSNYTIFIVWNFNAINGQNGRLLGFAASGGVDYQNGFDFNPQNLNSPVVFVSEGNISGATISPNSYTSSTGPVVLTINVTSSINLSLRSWGFGTPNFQPTANGNIVGANWGEMIVFNSTLTTAQQKRIQGYLAKKWALTPPTVFLPLSHPYSTLQPYNRGFTPLDIDGCQLWLDAADSSSLILNGSNVTQWNDKSGNGNNTNLTAGTPILTTNAINGKSAINFDSLSWFHGPAANTGTTLTAIAVGTMNGSNSNGATNNYLRMVTFAVPGTDFNTTPNTCAIIRDGTNNAVVAYRANSSKSPVGISLASPFVAVSVFDGTNQTMYVNGLSGTSSSSTGNFGYTQYGIGHDPGGDATPWNGYIAEVIVYNSAITTAQRQQLEGYLAWKWGINGQIQSFNPTSIPGCSLWLDASDSSTITTSGSTVTQWNDKSGRGLSATSNTYTGIGLPTYNSSGTKYVQLGESQGLLVNNWGYTTGWSCFVALNTVSLNNRWLISPFNGVSNVMMGMNVDSSKIWPALLPSPGADVTGNHIENTNAVNTNSNALLSWYRDGVLRTNNTTNPGVAANSTCPLGIGGNATINDARSGTYNIYEIIIYNTALSTSQRQQVETYLSKKWNISLSNTNYLPVSHPYRSLPPSTVGFNPTGLSGALLWLDAADSSAIGLSSGSNMSVWFDKSGNGYHAMAYSNPVYSSRDKRIVVNGGNYFWNAVMPFNLSARTIFIVFEEGPLNTGARGIMGFIPNPSNSGYDYSTNNSMTIESNNGIRFYQNGNYSPYDMGTNPLPKGIYCDTLSGSTGYGLINGSVQRISTAYTTFGTSVGYDIAARWDVNNATTPHAFGISGYFYEILIYNFALTRTQRQQVETYLAWKWGLQGTLPMYHPGYSVPAANKIAFFTPLQISGLSLWLDASDNSTVYADTSFTTTATLGAGANGWKDKSGNGRNMTANSTTSYALYNGRPSIKFGNNYFSVSSSVDLTQLTVFIVVLSQGSTDNQTVFTAAPNSSSYSDYNSTSAFGFFLDTSSTNKARFHGGLQNSTVANDVIPAGTTERFPINIMSYTETSNGTLNSYISGATGSTVVGAYSRTNGCLGFSVGGDYNNSTTVNYSSSQANVFEIIVYNTVLTSSQRQQVEGYLAWKWSLQSNLPSSHPYYSIPPSLQYTSPFNQLTFNPKQISGLTVWLDGADTSISSMTLSGNLITTWKDKSGNGNNATAVGSGATLTSSGVLFTGTGYSVNYTCSPTYETAFVVYNITAATYSNFETLIGCTVSAGRETGLKDGTAYFGMVRSHVGWLATLPVNVGALTLAESFVNNGTTYVGVNGTYSSNVSGTFSNGTTFIGDNYDKNLKTYGYINEVVIYNSVLTSSQIRKVEAYLALKWGLQGILPSSDPNYYPALLNQIVFAPSQISGLSLWLDAADASSITLNGSTVSQWKDKSSNGFSFTQSTSGNQPSYISNAQNSNNLIRFSSASSQYLGGSTSELLGSNSITAYAVFKYTDTTSGGYIFARSLYGGADGRILFGRDAGSPATLHWGAVLSNNAVGYVDYSDTYTSGAYRVYGSVINRSTGYGVAYQNGTSNGSITFTPDSNAYATSYNMIVGGYDNSSGNISPPQSGLYLNGDICEIVIYKTALTDSQRQQVEGYLAWKWGLQSSLPSTHAYYKAAPGLYTVSSKIPTSIPQDAYSYLILDVSSSDSGALPQTVTTNGSVTYTTIAGKMCAYFNNSFSNYLSLPFTPRTTLTICFWLYAIDSGGYTAVSITNSSFNPSLQVDLPNSTTTQIPTAMPSQWTNVPSGAYGGPGQWAHFAITVNYTTFVEQLYINGSLVSTATGTGATGIAQTLFVLGRSGDNGRAFYGYLRQFLFYPRILSASEISAIYTNTA